MKALPKILVTAGFTLLLRAGADAGEFPRWVPATAPAPASADEAATRVPQTIHPQSVAPPALVLACGDGLVDQAELLTNGDFENGGFAGWTVFNQAGSAGSFVLDTPGTTVPGSGFPTAPNPGGGAVYAVTDMIGSGAHALMQTFSVPPEGRRVILRFEMFVDDWSGIGPIVHAAGLDYTAGANQHFRVDLLAAGSPPLDTTGGVVANLVIGVDPGPPNPYQPYVFDLTGVALPGETYILRFAGVENQSFLHGGVDNVSITAAETCDPPGVPAGQPDECRLNCGFCGDGVADAIELLRNGDFETPALAGWAVDNQVGSAGSFISDTPGTTAPLSGNPTAPNADGGAIYAVMDMTGPGAHALSQTFKAPPSAHRVTLRFEMFANDWSGAGPIVDPAGLVYSTGPNQHVRVDLLADGSPPLDTGAGVLRNFYLGVDPGASPHPYTSYTFDLTGVAVPGGSYAIRFAGVENQLHLNLGVDNVSIVAEEECDDANNTPGDGCGADCTVEICGDGTIDFGETCDPPGAPAGLPSECRADCTFCGDGIVDPGAALATNGDFEAGVFNPWMTDNATGSAGTFVLSAPGALIPSTGHPTAPNPGGGGAFYAVTDMTGPGTHILMYTFTVPPGKSQVGLSFEMFVNDWSGVGPVVNAAGLTHTMGANQHARVDLLAAGSPPFDTGAGVLRNLYLGVDAGVLPNPYRQYTFDLTGVALSGGTYVLRFAGVETLSYLHVGVDNVRIIAGEECDDGNTTSGDGCSEECLSECGNGVINPPIEQCDPPGPLPGGSDCCAAHPGAGCADPVCADLVCDQSPACCTVGWDAACAALANALPQCISGCTSESVCTPQCCIDSEGDGICDLVDACPLTPNPNNVTALFDHPIIAIDTGTFAWSQPEYVQWVTGNIPGIGTYSETASGSLAAATTLAAPGVPAVGTGFWWMVKPDCGLGSWSTGSTQECSPPGVCPPGGRDGNLPPN